MLTRRVFSRVVAATAIGTGFMVRSGSAQTQATADALLSAAEAQAADGSRCIFAIFHASWWGWCHKLDSFIESASIKPIIDKYFVTVHFRVEEQATSKETNTPGADTLLTRWGGTSTIPFFAFLDSKGNRIVNSIRPADADGKHGGEIGHPYESWEVDWFLKMLRDAVPQMTADELGTIEKMLRSQKK